MTSSDKDYYNLTISISKALSSIEAPIKTKHVRAAIIGTFHNKGAQAFWAISIRQPLQENRIIAWKFCHLLHKVLREGHQFCCQHSMRHRSMLIEVGKLWGHLNDGYGLCIKHYTKLMVTKLEFHDRNPRIPGSLVLKRGELEQIGGGDINFYFQLAVEMFDYLDDIVALQATIFTSMSTFYINSMTPPGQCRLAPLIPCIQDSNQLYDFVVRIMFRLHANLPSDLLTGHRQRFSTLFHQLKSFYSQSRTLQYFVGLITVPKFPDTQPNFLQQSDLGNYTAPVVVMPDAEPVEEADISVNNLVDTTAPVPVPVPIPVVPPRPPAPQPTVDYERIIQERDEMIRHLQGEVEKLTIFIKTATNGQRESQSRYEEEISHLNSDLSTVREELTNMRIEKDELELKAGIAPTLEQKAQEEEERAKATEEKFNKLKNMYTQIRDEHINLLRQHGEVTKQLEGSKKIASEATIAKEEIKSQLEELEVKQSTVQETLQQKSVILVKENEEISENLEKLREENETLRNKWAEVEADKSAEIAELKINLEKIEKELETVKLSTEELETEKTALKTECEQLKGENIEFETKYQGTLAVVQDLEIKTAERSREEATLQQSVSEKDTAILDLQKKIEELISQYDTISSQCETLEAKNSQLTTEYQQKHEQDLNKQEEQMTSFMAQIEEIKSEKEELEAKQTEALSSIGELKVQLEEKQVEFKNIIKEKNAIVEEKDTELIEMKEKIEQREIKYQELIEQKNEIDTKHHIVLATIQDLEIKTQEYSKEEATLQQSVSAKEEKLSELTGKIEQLESQYEEMSTNYNILKLEKEEQTKELEEKLVKQEADKEEVTQSLKAQLEEVAHQKEELETEKSTALSNIEEIKVQLEEKITAIAIIEKEKCEIIEQKNTEITEMKSQLEEAEEKHQKMNANVERLLCEKCQFESDLQDLLHQQEQLDEKFKETVQKISYLESSLVNTKIHGETALRTLLESCIKSSEKITIRAINENEMTGANGTPSYFILQSEELKDILKKLSLVHENYLKDNSNNVEALARRIVQCGHLMANVHSQGIAVSNKSADIEFGERIAKELKDLGGSMTSLFKSLYTTSEAANVKLEINNLTEKLDKVTEKIGNLRKDNDSNEAIGDLVEKELAGMDKSIEEAAKRIEEMLSQSRASDSGVKLEVNGKILDACTVLMQSIRTLVVKSRLLQAEVVALGKGSASAKEFYKRNNQWTEGLISAAKSVAQGANFLLTAADKAVNGEAKHQLDLVVAAQEIAASTAQLVVASRVKAPRSSTNLTALGAASRSVTQATGAVVAIAKDSSQRLEESEDNDLTKLTLHQAKTKEMEIQVKVLELEQALNMERMKLSALRRHNYQSVGDDSK